MKTEDLEAFRMPLLHHLPPKLQAEIPRLMKFTLTGGVGFLVDYACTASFVEMGMNDIWARLPAFLIAVTVTWLVNRSLAFRGMSGISRKSLEAGSYLAIQTSGFLVNWAVYTLLKLTHWEIFDGVFLPLLAGSAAAYLFNYLNLRLFVYNRDSGAPEDRS